MIIKFIYARLIIESVRVLQLSEYQLFSYNIGTRWTDSFNDNETFVVIFATCNHRTRFSTAHAQIGTTSCILWELNTILPHAVIGFLFVLVVRGCEGEYSACKEKLAGLCWIYLKKGNRWNFTSYNRFSIFNYLSYRIKW